MTLYLASQERHRVSIVDSGPLFSYVLELMDPWVAVGSRLHLQWVDRRRSCLMDGEWRCSCSDAVEGGTEKKGGRHDYIHLPDTTPLTRQVRV